MPIDKIDNLVHIYFKPDIDSDFVSDELMDLSTIDLDEIYSETFATDVGTSQYQLFIEFRGEKFCYYPQDAVEIFIDIVSEWRNVKLKKDHMFSLDGYSIADFVYKSGFYFIFSPEDRGEPPDLRLDHGVEISDLLSSLEHAACQIFNLIRRHQR